MPELMHPQAMTIGCDPDYNAWTERRNPTRNGMELGPVRTAAGHVHIGVPNPNIAPIYRTYLARACDLMLGVPSILLEDDEENIRRQFYGAAGAYRPKPYGIEYRVLGNWWVKEDKYRKWIFNQAIRAVNTVEAAQMYEAKGYFNQKIAELIINTKNKELAEEYCRRFGIRLP